MGEHIKPQDGGMIMLIFSACMVYSRISFMLKGVLVNLALVATVNPFPFVN